MVFGGEAGSAVSYRCDRPILPDRLPPALGAGATRTLGNRRGLHITLTPLNPGKGRAAHDLAVLVPHHVCGDKQVVTLGASLRDEAGNGVDGPGHAGRQ